MKRLNIFNFRLNSCLESLSAIWTYVNADKIIVRRKQYFSQLKLPLWSSGRQIISLSELRHRSAVTFRTLTNKTQNKQRTTHTHNRI